MYARLVSLAGHPASRPIIIIEPLLYCGRNPRDSSLVSPSNLLGVTGAYSSFGALFWDRPIYAQLTRFELFLTRRAVIQFLKVAQCWRYPKALFPAFVGRDARIRTSLNPFRVIVTSREIPITRLLTLVATQLNFAQVPKRDCFSYNFTNLPVPPARLGACGTP